MAGKPEIGDPSRLARAAGRYRQMLCVLDETLDARLIKGAMRRVLFSQLLEKFDLILFDAYGVLNRGSLPIDGAVTAVERCRKLGFNFGVVSNNASERRERVWEKLQKMGFCFEKNQIVTSGMAVKPFLADSALHDQPYLLVGTADSASDYCPEPQRLLLNPPRGVQRDWEPAAFALFCSNRDYYGGPQQVAVEGRLGAGTIPLLLANPDVVVQDDCGGLVVVAGFTALELIEKFGGELVGIGKPFSPVFKLAMEGFPAVAPERVLMVGDSLSTDILGAVAMGFTTCLTMSGLHGGEGEGIEAFCREWRIQPDYIVDSIGT